MPQPGTLIEGKYEILGKIREGGMGTIYKVRHRLLDEVRVVKVMRPQILASEEMKRRFVEEARTATKLKHPNICTIYDFALDEDGTAYLVMEFIDGVTMAELLHSPTPPGLAMTLEIVHQSLLALGYLHRRNVVHRDVAPDNLMLTSDEEGRPVVKLIDLGIAKALDSTAGDMTSTGVFLGKLKYASPEQYGALPQGQKIDGRSDLYCMGVVMYELLTGDRPFAGDTPAEMLRAHLFQPPIPFSETDPENHVPPDIRSAVMKSLEKKREDRFPSAEDFDREILRLRDQLSSTDSQSTVAFVTKARASRGILTPGITPSAQDRMDRRFGAHATPYPSTPGASGPSAVDAEKTALSTPDAAAQATTHPLERPPQRARFQGIAAAAVIVAAIAVYAVWRTSRAPAASPARAALPAVATNADIAPSPPVLQPTAEAAAAIPAPTEPLPTATNPPPSPPPTSAPTRPTAAPRIRPTVAASASRREPPAVVAQRVDRPGTSISPESPTAPAVAPTPFPSRAPQPSARPAVAPATESGNPPAPGVSTDADKIRDTIRRYERAQNTLDVELYSRVYPGVDRSRVQAAFDNFRSQTVVFEQIRVDVAPGASRATVRLHERRVAVPRVGSEQHVDGDRTIQLRKEGDAWVIASLQ